MDLRLYYQKIRDAEAFIEDEFPIIVSRETGDGGRPGTLTEVPRRIAAKMVVEGVAQVASAMQRQSFLDAQAEAMRAAEQTLAASQVRVTVLSSADLEKFKNVRPAATK